MEKQDEAAKCELKKFQDDIQTALDEEARKAEENKKVWEAQKEETDKRKNEVRCLEVVIENGLT